MADPVWSPDGTKIAFIREGHIWVVEVPGTEGRRTHARAHPAPATRTMNHTLTGPPRAC
ncbi:MAG: PD40 domain-containing protein [Armatimonadetes bacterium]|nr:PD40 domain-containing protein [Armatimonadota bacterium]